MQKIKKIQPCGYVASLILCLMLTSGCGEPQQNFAQLSLANVLGRGAEQDSTGYQQALEPLLFSFPHDHGAHSGFRNEWWYFTGNLMAENGHRFGYQVTFFRIALAPGIAKRPSAWATHQIWMAHLAISDFEASEHWAAQRFARGALGFAGSDGPPVRVWLEDWQLALAADGQRWSLALKEKDFELDLQLVPLKPVALQGDQGLSRKGRAPANASYYYSIPRLATRGRLMLDGAQYRVQGASWLDREWSTSALEKEQLGWDWFALQLDSGEELMYYQMRRRDGAPDSHSHGSWVDQRGKVTPLSRDHIQLKPIRYWLSEQGEKFPVSWQLNWPAQNKQWRVDAVFDDQLMAMVVRYWEGAVTVTEVTSGRLVGRGYLEMTGY